MDRLTFALQHKKSPALASPAPLPVRRQLTFQDASNHVQPANDDEAAEDAEADADAHMALREATAKWRELVRTRVSRRVHRTSPTRPVQVR